MSFRRLIPLFTLVLMGLHASGIARAVHMLDHHTPGVVQPCTDGDHGPRNDQPAPPDDDDRHDCDLCLAFRAMHEVMPDVPTLIIETDLVSPPILPVLGISCPAPRAAPLGARAPPVC